jgi:hypothetical protein
MTNEEDTILDDMAAFIEWARENKMEFKEVLFTLTHDAGGIIRKERCFVPRTRGYRTHLIRSHEKVAT